MSAPPHTVTLPAISDPTLQALIRSWHNEANAEKKERIKQAILVLVEMQERSGFLARFFLKDFDTWNQVLTHEEADSDKAHKAEFYQPHLIEVLKQNNGKLQPIHAIRQVFDRVLDKLSLADLAVTPSKRLRYDTTIRFLAK
ncbi:MAG TPA: hypothetical protein VNG71_05400 [Pyrinomonadaceae bacterium]|nr:hypothetical protein [Pyrinomonadaceae bacterium]